MSTRYTSARFIATLTEILGWAVLLLGIAGAFALQRDLGALGMILSIAGTTLAGLILLAAAQITLAVLDTAESTADTAANSHSALAVLERIAAASMTASAETRALAAALAAQAPQATPANQTPAPDVEPAGSAEPVVHRGYRIFTDSRGNVSCDGRFFASQAKAKDWIDSVAKG